MKSRFEYFIVTLGAVLSIFVLANLWGFIEIDVWRFQAVILTGIFCLEYIPDIVKGQVSTARRIFYIVTLAMGVIPQIYLLFNVPRMEWFYGSLWTPGDIICGTMAILAILLMTHKKYGLAMPIIAAVFIAYTLLGHFLPSDFMGHTGFSFSRMVSFTFGPSAMYGTIMITFARIIFLYMLFGAFLQVSGVGEYLIQGSLAVAGQFRGGPAKVAIVSSALLGTINGNSVANVATTGAITIPLMKRIGYKPHFAGAVEAVSSTGGQILPPIMGAGAFIMAEFLQVSYAEVAIAAAIPAILYYLAVFLMVDLEAVKVGLKGVPRAELPSMKMIIRKSVLIVPILLLVYQLIIAKTSVTVAGISAIACSVLVSWFADKENRMGIKKVYFALYEGAKDSIAIASVCATAGIIVGAVSMTGLGTKFSSMVMSLAQGNMLLLGIFTALICLVLGMGLPTTAAYIITVTVAAPALIKSGVLPLAAHLFVFYYAILSAITPPVAGAAYAGASIAKAPVMRTGFTAVKLGIVAYLVPFFFINNQAIIAQGDAVTIIQSICTAVLGVTLIAMGAQNMTFRGKQPNIIMRAVYIIAALMLLDPGKTTDVFGLILAIGSIPVGYLLNKIWPAKPQQEEV